jgi:hypothetical protein
MNEQLPSNEETQAKDAQIERFAETLSEAYGLLERAHSILSIREAAMKTAKGQALLSHIARFMDGFPPETSVAPTDAQIDEFVSGLMHLFCVGDMVKTPHTMDSVAREMMRNWLAGFHVKAPAEPWCDACMGAHVPGDKSIGCPVKTSSPLCAPKCMDWPKCECGRGMP